MATATIAGVLGAYIVLFWILPGIWFALQAVEGVVSFRHPDVGVAFFATSGGL